MLVSKFPKEPSYQHELGGLLNNLAGLLRERGELQEARRLLVEALDFQRQALKASPQDPRHREFLINHYLGLANIAFSKRDHEEAAKVAAQLIEGLPDDWRAYFRAAQVLRGCALEALWDARLTAEDRRRRGQAYRERSAGLMVEAGRRDPDQPNAQNVIAWLLATWPDPKVRNPARAVELAKKAVDRMPTKGDYWNTLGVAQYRAGDWKAAVAALEKSMELGKGGNSADWLFLAMAHWKLGHKEESRKFYARAIEWMTKHRPTEELRLFRAEAAQLLGMKDEQK
jgi:tetratricopeptide (TPR) repeat protein